MKNEVFQRSTRQRRMILEELRSVSTHPTAQQLFEMVRVKLPKISLSTVYRNLEAMVKQGLILKLDNTSGQSRFDGNAAPHVHFECKSCGTITDAPAPPRELLDRHIEELVGCDIQSWHLEYSGTCRTCLQNH